VRYFVNRAPDVAPAAAPRQWHTHAPPPRPQNIRTVRLTNAMGGSVGGIVAQGLVQLSAVSANEIVSGFTFPLKL